METLKALEGTTIAVRTAGNPNKPPEVYVVAEITDDLPPLTILRRFRDPSEFLKIPTEMLLKGGEVDGRIVERISPEELELRSRAVREDRLTTSNRMYWGW